MCGFFGIYHKKEIKKNLNKFNKAADLISQRGPDDSRYIEFNQLQVKFFRLSILDLSNNGMQPMISQNNRYLMVFNGEIYNANILKKKLVNISFQGGSDSEVLFNLLILKGEKVVKDLEGMFSFVFFDKKEKKIIFCRDRFGIKPLYYYEDNKQIIFSSEKKPILKYKNINSLNKNTTLDFFLKGSMDHSEESFFNQVKSILPGHYVVYDSFKKKQICYWHINNDKKRINNFSEKLLIKKIQNKFLDSVDKHLISDRKVGLFLSGGTDSTALAYLMSKKINYNLQTYTYGFTNDKTYSEYSVAEKTARKLKISNTAIDVTPRDITDNMEKLVNILESPFTSIRIFGIYKLYELAKKDGLKVIIEGDGGDELFGGYDYNFLFYALDSVKKNKKLNDFYELIFKFIRLKNKKKSFERILMNYLITLTFQNGSTSDGTPYVESSNFNLNYLSQNIDENFYIQKKIKSLNNLQNSQLLDIYRLKLPRSLKYKDRISMNFGIETRIPFLDHNLASFAFNIPNNYKIRDFNTRYIFKKSITGLIKKKIIFKKTKKSLADPQTSWLKNELKDFVNDTFHSVFFKNIEIFNQKNVIKNFEKFCKSENNENSFQYFQMLTYSYFNKNFMKNKN